MVFPAGQFDQIGWVLFFALFFKWNGNIVVRGGDYFEPNVVGLGELEGVEMGKFCHPQQSRVIEAGKMWLTDLISEMICDEIANCMSFFYI